MDLEKRERYNNYYLVNELNENMINDYNINEATVVFNLDYSFFLQLNKIKLLIEVLADFTSEFFYLSYSIITKRVSITNIRRNLKVDFNIKKILKNIFKILKNELFITKRFDIEINKNDLENNCYYRIILRREEINENRYDYISEIQVNNNNNDSIFKASIVLKDDENMTYFKRNMKILKLIFKYFNNIEFTVIKSVMNIVMKEIELNIY